MHKKFINPYGKSMEQKEMRSKIMELNTTIQKDCVKHFHAFSALTIILFNNNYF